MKQFDITVVGGGASGLMAAVSAASACARKGIPAQIAVLEKNDRVGKKLLATGNGRCNLTNLHAGPEHYHGDAAQCGLILDRYPPQKIIKVFESMGLFCRELDEGRVYPYNLQASSVLNILRRTLEYANVEFLCGVPVTEVNEASSGFVLKSGDASVTARRVIFASGGMAAPQFGTDGNTFPVLKSLGHSVLETRPALVPVKTESARVRPLKGVRSPARAILYLDGKPTASTNGEVQFADGALSGICIFELARYIGNPSEKSVISLDFMPDVSAEEIAARLRGIGEKIRTLPASQLLEGMLHKALAAEVTRAAVGDPARPAGTLSDRDYLCIARTVRDFRFPVLGSRSWDSAQVTAGGVPLTELDETLQSRFRRGIYLCGELLNIDGDCGGYNLQWAWASGITAGEAASASLAEQGEKGGAQ